jgi:hypothetical protein
MITNIIDGKELSEQRIELMNKQRITEYGENNKDFRKYEQESTFFFVEDDMQVYAFGMLKPVTITLQDKHYDILGIGNIIAVQKGMGYGKTLMTAIKEYLQQHDKTGLGFCWPTVSQFYRQCGYEVFDDLSDRFRYSFAARDGRKDRQEQGIGIGVLYYASSDRLMDHITRTDDLIYVNVPFW